VPLWKSFWFKFLVFFLSSNDVPDNIILNKGLSIIAGEFHKPLDWHLSTFCFVSGEMYTFIYRHKESWEKSSGIMVVLALRASRIFADDFY
jgi:hypothetical protein